GYRSPASGLASASYVARFPGDIEPAVPATFAGIGTVWASTVVRIPNGEYAADRVIHYVDIDEGPRVLCESAAPIAVGTRVRIVSVSPQGAPVVEAVEAVETA